MGAVSMICAAIESGVDVNVKLPHEVQICKYTHVHVAVILVYYL